MKETVEVVIRIWEREGTKLIPSKGRVQLMAPSCLNPWVHQFH